jgi:hypothetical protein
VASPLGRWGAVRRVVLLVVDGFGWDQVTRAMNMGHMPTLARRLAEGGAAMEPISTVFPSMTPVVLTSILCGAFPSQHGITGQSVAIGGQTVEVLHDPWPDACQPAVAVPDLAAQLARRHLAYHVLLEHRLLKGPLTEILHGRAGQVTTFIAASGLPVLLEELLDADEPGAIYAYWSAVDSINHERGAFGVEWAAEVASLDRWLGRLCQSSRPGTQLWITADHGHIRIQHPLSYFALREDLGWLPERPAMSGNGIGLTVDTADLDALKEAAARRFGSAVEFYDVADLWERGLWGPPHHPAFRDRVGRVLMWARDPGAEWVLRPDRAPHHSSHGGITPAEMRVPWIEVALD